MIDHNYKFGFTLAEVLITLGIIGVVAAMTMPTLIVNYQKKQTVVQLKKVYSDLSNAAKLSEADNGPMSDWNTPTEYINTSSQIYPYLSQYWLPYFQGAKFVDHTELPGYYMLGDKPRPSYVILNNGVILSFFTNGSGSYMWILTDINGLKGPNRVGRDIFVFDAQNNGLSVGNVYRINFWGKYVAYSDAALKANSGYGCNKDNTDVYKNFYCGILIEKNGWEIPSDYPW